MVESQFPIERSLWERSVILRSLRTRLLLLGQVEPTKFQEGTYLQTPYDPKPKDLSAL